MNGRGRPSRWPLILVLLLAFALRLAIVMEIGFADLDLTASPGADMHVFWENSGQIAAGDLLLRHRSGWEKYLEQTMGAERVQRFYGPSTYYNPPLYVYFVGLLRALYGSNPLAVLLVQSILSTATVFLVYLWARELYGRTVAVIAALLAAIQDTLIFYGAFVLRETLYVFLVVLATLLFTLAGRRPGWRWPVGAGIVFALAWLTKAEASFIFPFLVLASVWKSALPHRARRLVLLLAASTVTILPFCARNLAVGVAPLQMSCYELTGFVAANLPSCPPKGLDLPAAEMRSVIDATDGKFFPSVRETLARHGSPWRYALFVGRKLVASCNAYEPWNNVNLVYFRHFLQLFRLPLLTTGLLLPLGFLGMALDLRRIPDHIGPFGIVFGTWAFMAVSFVIDRYRLTAYPALAIFAAHALLTLARWVRERHLARALLGAAAFVVLCITLRDKDSPLQIDRAATEHVGTYMTLRRPWAATYVLLHCRSLSPVERELLARVRRS